MTRRFETVLERYVSRSWGAVDGAERVAGAPSWERVGVHLLGPLGYETDVWVRKCWTHVSLTFLRFLRELRSKTSSSGAVEPRTFLFSLFLLFGSGNVLIMIRTDADRRGVYSTEPFLAVDVERYLGEAKIPNARSNFVFFKYNINIDIYTYMKTQTYEHMHAHSTPINIFK
jgi:hypothetical protein